MPKFKTLNNQIPGLIRNCSPIRNEDRKGVAYRSKGAIFMREIYKDYLDVIPSAVQHGWTLDLRDLTGAFHAGMYIEDHFNELAAHGVKYGSDFEVVLGGGPKETMEASLYHGAWAHAMDGKPLTTPERKALAKIVLWVAERVN